MVTPDNGRLHNIAVAARALVTLEAAAYIVAATLHMGIEIPLWFAVLSEPPILPATIVEGMSGILLAVSAYALFTRRDWGWGFAVGSHIFAIAGIMLGITALALGGAPNTELNYYYHRIVLVALAGTLTLLLTPAGREALADTEPPVPDRWRSSRNCG